MKQGSRHASAGWNEGGASLTASSAQPRSLISKKAEYLYQRCCPKKVCLANCWKLMGRWGLCTLLSLLLCMFESFHNKNLKTFLSFSYLKHMKSPYPSFHEVWIYYLTSEKTRFIHHSMGRRDIEGLPPVYSEHKVKEARSDVHILTQGKDNWKGKAYLYFYEDIIYRQ